MVVLDMVVLDMDVLVVWDMDVVDNMELDMDVLVVWDMDMVDDVELDALDNVELERDVVYDVELVDGVYYEVYFYSSYHGHGHHGLVVSYYGASYHMAFYQHMAFCEDVFSY